MIVSAVRTPFGKLGGGLAAYPATALGSTAIRAALERRLDREATELRRLVAREAAAELAERRAHGGDDDRASHGASVAERATPSGAGSGYAGVDADSASHLGLAVAQRARIGV